MKYLSLVLIALLLTSTTALGQVSVSNPPVTVQELDGDPKATMVTKISVSNSTLTKISNREVQINTGSGAGPGTPGGSDTEVQYNNAGVLDGISSFTTNGTNLLTLTGALNIGDGTLEIPNSTTLPATCTVGEVYVDLDAVNAAKIFLCTSTNTWELQIGVDPDDWTTHNNYPDPCDTDEYVTAIGDTLTCSPSNSVSPWDEDATTIFQNDLSKDVAVGAATSPDNAKLGITAESDQVQFLIRGFLAQASNLMEAQKSDGTKVFQLGLTGSLSLGDGTAGGAISMLELAAAPADVAGRGQYWVKNDTPNTPYFTDDTGVDHNLLDAGTVDHGATTGLGDDDHTQYALLAGRAGGQTLIGGTAAGNDITLQTTSNGSKGSYILSELVNCDTIDTDANGVLACGSDSGAADHGTLTGLSDDDHTQYALLAGRAGGQTIIGGTAAGNDLTLQTTSNGTKGTYFLSELTNCNTIDTDANGGLSCGTDAGGYTALSSFVDETAWRVYYSNGSGDITALALGSDGTYLKSNGASAAPTFATPSTTSGNFFFRVFPESGKLPATNPMTVDSNGDGRWAGRFDSTTDECAQWSTILYPYNGGTLQFKGLYSMYAANTGTKYVSVAVSMMCVSPGDSADVDTDSFGTVDYITDQVDNTAGYLSTADDSSLNGDSCAQNDIVIFKICRDADASGGGTDDATDDMELREALFFE